ncbi:hypothetical protein KF728_16645 [Candidatus Obscuribacterales bacterium]|nr:hypothetical protein [Candidatus Obscuribacterales bacterium]MBX3151787.1 hypothetical protein [Candidatus Obscuribacterales bacterium]
MKTTSLKVLHLGCLAAALATASGIMYGTSRPIAPRQISWVELQSLMDKRNASNIKKIVCRCKFFPTPDTNSLAIQLKNSECELIVSSSEMPVALIGTSGCGALGHEQSQVNKRLIWVFQQALANGIDLELKAHAPVNGNKYLTSSLIYSGKPTPEYPYGLLVAGPRKGEAPWLVDKPSASRKPSSTM